MNIKNLIRDITPTLVHELLISVFNKYQRSIRYGGKYNQFKIFYKDSFNWSKEELDSYSSAELEKILSHATSESKYYKKLIPNISGNNLFDFPILSKNNLRISLPEIQTIPDSAGVVNYTGGTTGSSTKNIFTKLDVQKRNAFLDAFREKYGYKLGEETAWFSGKEILSNRDINSGKFFKRDFFSHINYYSTFHININTIDSYIEAINKQQPKFLVGFPSSIVEIATLAIENNIKLDFQVNVVFPTAEKVTSHHRNIIEKFYGAKVIDQYASSEGAPFILECSNGNYHLQKQTGVFEFVGDSDSDIKELIVTSFSTYGTPLIRYQIGDTVEVSDAVCNCGDANIVIKEIGGRVDDFLLASNGSKVNLGNLSNATKNVEGIIQFQVIQDVHNVVNVKLIKAKEFTELEKAKFLSNLHYRLGENFEINLTYVEEIPVESSGKFRIVKNNIGKV